MIRTLKATGLALVAILALGVMAASASAAEFHSEAATTTIDSTQTTANKFVTGAGTVECSTANYSGTQTGATAKSVTVTPSYSGCSAFGFANTHVEVTGCTMTLFADTSSTLQCGATGHIVITPTFFGSVCTVTIGGHQSFGKGSVEYTNIAGPPKDIRVHQKVTGIAYSVTKSGCGQAVGSYTDGTLSGTQTVVCTQPANVQINCWWE